MKICAISDLHGNYDFNIEPCNILFICGDIVPLKIQQNIPQSLKWFKTDFIEWCSKQPVEFIFIVGGNHDFFLEKLEFEIKEILRGTNIKILYNERAEYMDNDGKIWTIWGSPLCHMFGNWAFMYSDEYEEKEFSKIPDDLDFLITHDAAFGRNDVLLDKSVWWANGAHIGNPALAKVLSNKSPKYHFTGHLHSTDHNIVDYNGTKTACVSLLDEHYNMTYKPLYLEL